MIDTLINIGAFLIGLKFVLFFIFLGVMLVFGIIAKIGESFNNNNKKDYGKKDYTNYND